MLVICFWLAQIAKEKGKAQIKGFAQAAKQLALWDPYDQNATDPFFDPHWMFGIDRQHPRSGCGEVLLGRAGVRC